MCVPEFDISHPLCCFSFQPASVTNAVVCAILSVGWCIYKNPCCLLKRVAHVVVTASFLTVSVVFYHKYNVLSVS